ncbi:MAG: InlB B-repeat-containing protein, partial [Treponema sp.]|nr:InlB B-repeat-containing protein [Treponema sp.]
VGVEFQLDAVTTGGARDAILTWNGVNGQSYNQVANYGRAMLVTGDLAARGITRGANDPVPVTVTFDTNGGTPATIAPISVTPGLPAGTLFPEDPTPPSGYRFTGWYDESVTPNVRYSSTTIINNDLNLKARYTESSGSGTLIWSMADWLVTYPPKENGEILYYSSSARPFTVTSSSTPALVVDGGIDIVGRTANYYTMTLWIDDSMPSSSYGGIRGLNLDPEGRIYEIRVTGSALETPKADVQMTLKAGGGQADLGIVSDTLAEVDGAPYTIIGEIPADFNSRTDGRGEIRILPSDSFNSTSNGFMSFRIDSVEVWDMGSRSGSSGYLFSLSDWIADNPEVTELTTSSTAHKPLRLNGTVPTSNSATIVGSDMELYINASGQGLHIMLDSENLDLKPVENIYEVRIAGYISDLGTGSTPGGTPAIRIQTYYGGTATVLEGDLSLKPSSGDAYVGFEFAKAVELPATAINPGDSVRITVSSNAATMTFIMTKIEIEDKGPREGGGGEEPEPEPPALGVIFNLDDWFTANPTVTEITSTGGIGYLGRSSSGTLITIVDVDGSKEINIRYQQGLGGTDSGTTHGLDIKIDSASLNVTTDTRLYGLRIDGYVVGTPPAGQGMRLRNSGGTVTYGSTTLEEELDAVFNITTAELPASSSSDVMRIQLNPALATGTELNVRITGIEIEDLGPRE